MKLQPTLTFKVATAVVALLLIIGFVHFFGPVPDRSTKSAKMDVWFFALDSREGGIHMYAKQAVLSAKAKTSLIPVCLYHGDPTIITPIEHWLLDNDVVVLHTEGNSFMQEIEALAPISLGIGTWLRMVIPQAVQALQEPSGEFEGVRSVQRGAGPGPGSPGGLNASRSSSPYVGHEQFKGVNLQYVLYTDVDVHFLGDVNAALRAEHMPQYVACAVQGNYGSTRYKELTMYNAGVMVMNVPGYSSVLGQFREAVIGHISRAVKGHYWVGSQGAFKNFFPIKLGTWDYLMALAVRGTHPSFHTEQGATYHALRLPKELEWEPYLGVNPAALLLHWHGPKMKNVKDCAAAALTVEQRLDGLSSSSDPNIQKLIAFNSHSAGGYAAAVLVFQHYYAQLCGGELDLGAYGESVKSQVPLFSSFASLNSTSTTEGRNGQPKVRLAGGEHSCDVYLYGCTVASWVHSGTEKLFCSPITPFDGKKAIRGGIPLVFPQFGRPDESMPQHGFARTSNWTLAGTGGGESAIAVFGLTNGEHSLSWPHKFALEYTVELSAAGLRTSIKISNTDATPFSCQTLLHTYVAVPAIERVQVRGLQGSYYDQLAACTAQDDRAVATVDAEVDRIYTASVANPPSVEVAADGLLLVKVDRRAYKLIGDAPLPIPTPADVVFWNAWVDKTASIGDLENDAYLRYICVEPGVVSSAQEVQPGTSMVLEQTLTC